MPGDGLPGILGRVSLRRLLPFTGRSGGVAPTGRRVLITGGARSGKSRLAEQTLGDRADVVYLATGAVPSPADPEWSARVAEHQARRPATWTTVETADAAAVLAAATPPASAPAAVLFDCVGTWLTAAMDAAGIWAPLDDPATARPGAIAGATARLPTDDATGPAGIAATRAAIGRDADAALARAVDGLVAAWSGTAAHVVAVTNEVGSGVVPATASGRRFRDELGLLNARLAAVADEVWLCTAGIPLRIR
jgi:adenosylcobinamide kinase/adenosylcobinamide-phosphate guanylyltransferase